MKRFLLIIALMSTINILNAQTPIDKALKTFETTIGADVQKSFSQYGDLIDFSYMDKEKSTSSYITIKQSGTIVCYSNDVDEDEFPANINTKIQNLYPKEYKKGQIGNYRIGKDTKNASVYIIIITSKDDDTIVIMDKNGTIKYKYEME